MIGDHLKVVPPSGSSVDAVKIAFTTVIIQTAERVALLQDCRLPRRGWMGGAQEEEEWSIAMTARRAAWKQQKADTQDSQLCRDVNL